MTLTKKRLSVGEYYPNYRPDFLAAFRDVFFDGQLPAHRLRAATRAVSADDSGHIVFSY
ncbi:MAG: hypothetical protein RL088_3750 [Verrucomicrobiota bacterium]